MESEGFCAYSNVPAVSVASWSYMDRKSKKDVIVLTIGQRKGNVDRLDDCALHLLAAEGRSGMFHGSIICTLLLP